MKLEPVETTTKYRNLGILPLYLFYIATILSVTLGIYYVFGFSVAGFSFMNWSYYYLLMGLLMPFVFIFFPMFPKAKQIGTKIPWYDIAAAILACVIPIYLATIAQKIDDMGW